MTDQMIPTESPEVTDELLREVDAAIDRAVASNDVSELNVIGFGEVSVALGWPSDAPELVIKRVLLYGSRASAERNFAEIERYVDTLRSGGMDVLATTMHIVDRPDGRASGYVVQPLVPKQLLAENILAANEPRADHPLVLAHREAVVNHCTADYVLDIQISNFAYDGDRYVTLDITSPVTFGPAGEFTGPIPDEMVAMVPAFMRSTFRKEYAKAASGLRSARGGLYSSIVWLHRVGQGRWSNAFAEAFNEVVDEPIDVDEARKEFERFKKVIPMVKNTSRLQRWWQTTVRRQPFDTFITDSFSGELL